MSVNAEPPAVALEGDREVNVGAGLLIVKLCPLEVPPPGVGLKTVTVAVPAVAMSAAVIAAVNCVLLTNVVVRLDPFQRTVEVLRKLVPLAVSVNATPPAVALVGEIEVSEGRGLLMVKVWGLEVPPPGAGFTTVTLALPTVAMSLGAIEAVS
jgi:hypothetical protein